ncbi:MAG: hypothetical protein UH071_10255, partial [Paludibacteraceae bacterium]|nr:hypothetical protein [Paludibacteraceae bacterium]
ASKLEHVKVEERRQGERTTYVATFGDETYELKQKKAERKLSNGDFVTIISYNKHKFSKDITYFCGEHDYEIEKNKFIFSSSKIGRTPSNFAASKQRKRTFLEFDAAFLSIR